MIKKNWENFCVEVLKELNNEFEKKTVNAVMNILNLKKNVLTTEKKSKGKKDQNAPKRWNTGYIIFCVNYRNKLKEENPNMTTTEITSKLGNIWKNLSEKEKTHYQELSKKDKERYDNEMKSYTTKEQEDHNEEDKPVNQKNKQVKRPMTAYLHFLKDNRDDFKSKNPDLTSAQITSGLAKMWKALSAKEKELYVKKQSEDSSTYTKQTETVLNNNTSKYKPKTTYESECDSELESE